MTTFCIAFYEPYFSTNKWSFTFEKFIEKIAFLSGMQNCRCRLKTVKRFLFFVLPSLINVLPLDDVEALQGWRGELCRSGVFHRTGTRLHIYINTAGVWNTLCGVLTPGVFLTHGVCWFPCGQARGNNTLSTIFRRFVALTEVLISFLKK